MRRGQAIAFDLLVACFLFMALFFLFTGFNDRLFHEGQDAYGEMLVKSYAISFVLAENPGVPAGWTFLNFSRPGVAVEPNSLDENRLLNLMAANFTRLKQSLGADEFEMRIRLLKTDDSTALVGGWANSLGQVAYTKGGHEVSEGGAISWGVRDWLETNNVTFDNYNQTNSKKDFFNLLGNISRYDTVILDDPDVAYDDLSSAEKSQFSTWVKNGGSYIHRDGGDVIRIAGANYSADGPASGTISILGNMVFNASVGDTVTCSESAAVNNTNTQADMKNLVKHVVNSNQEALVASWSYGLGRVFFACDMIGSVSGSVSRDNIRSILTVLGIRGEAGDAPVNATTIAPVVTTVNVGGNTRRLEVTLWKKA